MFAQRIAHRHAIGAALDPHPPHVRGIDAADQLIAEEKRADIPAPFAQLRRLVDLPDVVEAEDVAYKVAIPDQRIEGTEDADAVVVARGALFEELGHGQVTTR